MLRKVAAGVIAASAAVLLSASPAAAAQDIYANTTDPFNGGIARFTAHGEHFSVCDGKPDGKRAVAHWAAFTPGQTVYGTLHDSNGSGNDCATANKSFPEGTSVSLRVCLRDGANGADQYCSSTRWGTA